MYQGSAGSSLDEIVQAQHRGEARGIYAICSSNPWVIEAGLHQGLEADSPVLIESTCNQVNQQGGYTGLTPAGFNTFLLALAEKAGFPHQRMLLGGDHLGPNPWRKQTTARAMDHARELVRACVQAGYVKLHLDASMPCGDDPAHLPLPPEVVADRVAELAWVAENTYRQSDASQPLPRYVIGTEVPPPGGTQASDEVIAVTNPADLEETIALTRAAFQRRGLEAAWERAYAVVVQPGVEYGDETLFEYDRSQAQSLSRFIEQYPGLIYEAHSTDYQSRQALRDLVEDHFAILKVGPALTFSFRETIFALAAIEAEWLGGHGLRLSNIREVMEAAMLGQPGYWEPYYRGTPAEQRFARRFSFSDRVRYYWPIEEVQAALKVLLRNLGRSPLPLTLLSQYLPAQYAKVRDRALPNTPRMVILDKIRAVLQDYHFACGLPSAIIEEN